MFKSAFPMALAALALSLAACHKQAQTAAQDQQALAIGVVAQTTAGQPVIINNMAFNPPSMHVPAGTTVVWSNRDNSVHTVTATGLFDSGPIGVGGTFAFTFQKKGTYAYWCANHPEMRGEVVVE